MERTNTLDGHYVVPVIIVNPDNMVGILKQYKENLCALRFDAVVHTSNHTTQELIEQFDLKYDDCFIIKSGYIAGIFAQLNHGIYLEEIIARRILGTMENYLQNETPTAVINIDDLIAYFQELERSNPSLVIEKLTRYKITDISKWT